MIGICLEYALTQPCQCQRTVLISLKRDTLTHVPVVLVPVFAFALLHAQRYTREILNVSRHLYFS